MDIIRMPAKTIIRLHNQPELEAWSQILRITEYVLTGDTSGKNFREDAAVSKIQRMFLLLKTVYSIRGRLGLQLLRLPFTF